MPTRQIVRTNSRVPQSSSPVGSLTRQRRSALPLRVGETNTPKTPTPAIASAGARLGHDFGRVAVGLQNGSRIEGTYPVVSRFPEGLSLRRCLPHLPGPRAGQADREPTPRQV